MPRGLLSFSREALALARQALLLRHDVTASAVPEIAPGSDVVIFLHGVFATAGVLRPLRAAVERHAGLRTAALTYAPGPGVAAIASQLGELVGSLPSPRLHLVGHSLGGIVARYFVERCPDARVVQTISLASPFAGMANASLLPLAFARDLAPDGAILREIRLGSKASLAVPHLSIIAADDGLIPAPITQALPLGDVEVLHDVGHAALLFDPRVAALVQERILATRVSAVNMQRVAL